MNNMKLDVGDGCKGVDKIELAQGRDHWQVFVDTITKLRVSQKVSNSIYTLPLYS
jgi:hypothetical protein